MSHYPVYIPEYALSHTHLYYEDVVSWSRDKEGIMRYDTDRYDLGQLFLKTSWGRLVQSMAGLPTVRCAGTANVDIDRFANELRSKVVSEALQSFDLGTEFAEFGETAKTIMGLIRAAHHPLRSFRDARNAVMRNGRLSSAKAVEKAENLWMQYRYAIMPIMYSIKDADKLGRLKKADFQTFRAAKNLSFESQPDGLHSLKGVHLYTREQLSVRLHAMSKICLRNVPWSSVLRDQVGLNPFQTAWEKIPYSFVVDWFANVGDWILSRTASLVPNEVQKSFCQSVKITSIQETRVRLNRFDENLFPWEYQHADMSRVSGVDSYPVLDTVDECIQRTVTESYIRSPFNPSDVKFQIGPPNLNWKRWIDAFVLGHRPLIKSLRSLR